jgi:hypothetical protein
MTKRRRPIRRLERTAYHEAGHAVIALVLNRRFRYVTIRPSEDGESLGRVRFWNCTRYASLCDYPRDIANAKIIVACAGFFQARTSKQGWQLLRGPDRDEVVDYLFSYEMPPAERSAYCKWLFERTKTLIRLWQPAISIVAQRLLKCEALNEGDVRQLVIEWRESVRPRPDSFAEVPAVPRHLRRHIARLRAGTKAH